MLIARVLVCTVGGGRSKGTKALSVWKKFGTRGVGCGLLLLLLLLVVVVVVG